MEKEDLNINHGFAINSSVTICQFLKIFRRTPRINMKIFRRLYLNYSFSLFTCIYLAVNIAYIFCYITAEFCSNYTNCSNLYHSHSYMPNVSSSFPKPWDREGSRSPSERPWYKMLSTSRTRASPVPLLFYWYIAVGTLVRITSASWKRHRRPSYLIYFTTLKTSIVSVIYCILNIKEFTLLVVVVIRKTSISSVLDSLQGM